MEQSEKRVGNRFRFEGEKVKELWHSIRDTTGCLIMLLGWYVMSVDGRYVHVALMAKVFNDYEEQNTGRTVT